MKTTDDELNAWRFDQKRAPVSVRITPGSEPFLYMFMGEAKNLLWSVKNALNLNKHMQGDGNRTLKDGTRIRVKCIFGLDIVEIDTRRSTLLGAGVGPESCTITFINMPLSVPPMKNLPSAMNQGTIYPTDAEGVDYFKTYYSFTLNNCPTCKEIAWNLTFNYDQPIEERHFHNFASIPQMGVEPDEDDLNNHMIYSLSFPCYAEIISHGRDTGGYYIIWKAYTETPLWGTTYSRAGLGIMLIEAFILKSNGTVLCKQQAKVDVDCCQKASNLREVEIWWEGIWECQPFIIYGDVHLCKTPTSLAMGGMSGLNWYACMHPYQPFYSIPDVRGICLPVEWTLSGPIDFRGSDKNDNTIYIKCLESGCNEAATITLRDRCGGEYQIRARPCCEDAAPLEILYTSLLMSCSQKQDLTALYGCEPYSWTITEGGGTLDTDKGKTVTYTAPATNANCTNNPTIQVTDCCGNTAEVKLAVNCSSSTAIVLQYSYFIVEECDLPRVPPVCNGCDPAPQQVCVLASMHNTTYDCDGDVRSQCDTAAGRKCWASCDAGDPIYGCWTSECGGETECDTLVDKRTAQMKEAGCCPLNPLTGLPYDQF